MTKINPTKPESRIREKKERRDEYAIILDFLPRGYAKSKISMPIAQAIATTTLTLLELKSKPNVSLAIGEKVYIGSGERDKIESILRRLYYRNLTATAQKELERALQKIIEENELHFVEFFNKAESINIREHQLDLLPGMGKKTLWQILEERKKEPFKSFEDIKNRVPSMIDPKKAIIKRIIEELKGEEKIYLFTRPPYRGTRRKKMMRRFMKRR